MSSAAENVHPSAAVLAVDDHPANLLALEAIFETLDVQLVTATSGREALRLAGDVEVGGYDDIVSRREAKAVNRNRVLRRGRVPRERETGGRRRGTTSIRRRVVARGPRAG